MRDTPADEFHSSDTSGEQSPTDASDEERELARELVELLVSGRRIDAVKRYREATGSSLSDAVAFVNRISAEHGIARPSGCSTSSVLLFAATLATWWLS